MVVVVHSQTNHLGHHRHGSPGPAAYAAVPLMDRLRMTLNSRSTGRPLTVQRARPLTAFVNSSASLTATLSELRH